MQWFGESWGAHVCEGEHVATPVGAICFGSCAQPIAEGDQGVILPFLGFEAIGNTAPDAPYHIVCFLRALGCTLTKKQRPPESAPGRPS